MPDKSYFIGLISGTSIDAVDCALVSFTGGTPSLEATYQQQYSPQLRENVFKLCEQAQVPLTLLGETDVAVGSTFAEGVKALLSQAGLDSSQVTAIGSHGQTVFHHPESALPFTLQIGDPNTIAWRTGITTVADFRRKDMAAGGQGAPLAPLFHQFLFSDSNISRVVVNLGGIANISVIAEGFEGIGFDTGPANVLMDYWIHKHKNLAVDNQGKWGASGTVSSPLLELLLDDAYFSQPEPKSTGREYFNGSWLENRLATITEPLSPEDVQATLLDLTATTVATEIENQLCPDEVYLCGGGAHNLALVNRLTQLLSESKVLTTEALNLSPDWVEAVLFAWLAKQRIKGIPVDSRAITGASDPVILGGVYLPDQALNAAK
jgi:anhydro-N-acetylmuramic acid kinase